MHIHLAVHFSALEKDYIIQSVEWWRATSNRSIGGFTHSSASKTPDDLYVWIVHLSLMDLSLHVITGLIRSVTQWQPAGSSSTLQDSSEMTLSVTLETQVGTQLTINAHICFN